MSADDHRCHDLHVESAACRVSDHQHTNTEVIPSERSESRDLHLLWPEKLLLLCQPCQGCQFFQIFPDWPCRSSPEHNPFAADDLITGHSALRTENHTFFD